MGKEAQNVPVAALLFSKANDILGYADYKPSTLFLFPGQVHFLKIASFSIPNYAQKTHTRRFGCNVSVISGCSSCWNGEASPECVCCCPFVQQGQ